MATTYIEVLELEFDNLFKADKGWEKITNGGEFVYCYHSKKNADILVKVFSSVRTDQGIGRKCGSDAIRACAVNTKTNRGVIKSKRVHRTLGWDERIKERVVEILNKIW